MSNILVQIPKCEDVDCGEPLGYFDIKKRSRFCHKCRNHQFKVMRWKCKTCTNIIYGSQYRETKYYCDTCRGKPENHKFIA